MIYKRSLAFVTLLGFSLIAHAQGEQKVSPVQIRAVLHDPTQPTASLFYLDKTGAALPISFRSQALSAPFLMTPVDGSLMLYDKATIDPENPTHGLVASAKLPSDVRRAIVVVLPARSAEKVTYHLLVIDDSEKAFPGGGSLVLPLVRGSMGIQAGEHKLPIHPGKVTKVPPVKKVNDFNMAQTNFYYEQNDGAWIALAERQLQYLDVSRRLFIIHTTPGSIMPRVTTIVDTNFNRVVR